MAHFVRVAADSHPLVKVAYKIEAERHSFGWQPSGIEARPRLYFIHREGLFGLSTKEWEVPHLLWQTPGDVSDKLRALAFGFDNFRDAVVHAMPSTLVGIAACVEAWTVFELRHNGETSADVDARARARGDFARDPDREEARFAFALNMVSCEICTVARYRRGSRAGVLGGTADVLGDLPDALIELATTMSSCRAGLN